MVARAAPDLPAKPKQKKKTSLEPSSSTAFWSSSASSQACLFFFLGFSFLLSGLLIAASLRIQNAIPTLPSTVKSVSQVRLENSVHEMLEGYPMEAMEPYILERNRPTAAFLVGIAKKESNWGLRVPTQNGRDCYNYWGYTGEGSRGSSMGHGCFGSRKEAVDTVARRIDTLVYDFDLTTSADLVVWKCGYSCDGHSPAAVSKWIADVGYYTDQLENKE